MGDKHDELVTVTSEGPTDGRIGLDWVVGDVETFRTAVWSRRPMRRTATPGFETLIDVEMIDEWLARGARRPHFRIVKVGTKFDERAYTRTARIGGIDVAGVADAQAIAALVAGGATLVMQNLEFAFPNMRALIESFAVDVSHPIQANAYLTPPNAAGLGRHADNHDVLILQVDGSKTWDVDGLGEFEIGPGDVVYIPRGTPHVAHTSDQTSLHITLGLLRVTTRHVLRRMLDQLEPDLDDALPLNYAQMPLNELIDVLAPRISQAVATLASTDLSVTARAEVDRVSKHAASGGRALSSALASLDLTQDSMLRRTVACRLEMSGDRVVLQLPDRAVSFPAAAAPALRVLCRSEQLTVGQLIGIDQPSRVVVARRLVREGAVTPAID